MAYEIDFLPVGEGERSGDAIALRFGNLNNSSEQIVIVIDGGSKESGKALVQHIKTFYKTDRVNDVLCTHSDADHASGLTEVLETLSVGRLFMHLPWKHVENLDELLKNASTDSVRRHFKESLDHAHELENLAKRKGIPITEPFSDTVPSSNSFSILGPSVAFYEDLLQAFRCAPAPASALSLSVLQKILGGAKEAVKWLAENWGIETLAEPEAEDCSAENNSSVILLFTHGESRFLFTSDGGVPALTQAADCATNSGVDLRAVSGVQIPHHGSKDNVGPAILDRILGPKNREQKFTKTAIVSASKDAEPKHPSGEWGIRGLGDGERTYCSPKTESSIKPVPVIEPLRTMLVELRQADKNPSSGPILRGPSGCPLDLDNLAERVVKPALLRCAVCKRCQSKHTEVDHDFQLDQTFPKWHGWYSLRRGVATAVADLSDSLAAKGLLRHSNVSTTERHYIKDVPESTLAAMKLLETLCNQCANQGQAKTN